MRTTHAVNLCTSAYSALVQLHVIHSNSLEFSNLTSTVFDWAVGVPENALVQLYVEDAGDNDAWSGTVRCFCVVSLSPDTFYS